MSSNIFYSILISLRLSAPSELELELPTRDGGQTMVSESCFKLCAIESPHYALEAIRLGCLNENYETPSCQRRLSELSLAYEACVSCGYFDQSK